MIDESSSIVFCETFTRKDHIYNVNRSLSAVGQCLDTDNWKTSGASALLHAHVSRSSAAPRVAQAIRHERCTRGSSRTATRGRNWRRVTASLLRYLPTIQNHRLGTLPDIRILITPGWPQHPWVIHNQNVPLQTPLRAMLLPLLAQTELFLLAKTRLIPCPLPAKCLRYVNTCCSCFTLPYPTPLAKGVHAM
ncbi:hypothetical protein FIBSPDRAFT_940258 [Athelia psychrophila]|uniref:Uncharacterized protein n=1 Tax=Athelia psychrophila TaxID=1759441 RepID=A0A167WBD0_9AGAM|nr:hypothetical protein FIBSPDRAFT_940258 [Fibularhizoctonia sp. CBS 109695]